MIKKKHNTYLLLSVLLFLFCQEAKGTDLKASRLNIIFIMSDDHCLNGTGCYGSKVVKTPCIDKLASQGMRFTNMCVTNSLCGPSRAVLLTGKMNHLNGFTSNRSTFDGDQLTFPKLLQKAGYTTALIGKWHLKSEPQGFDHFNVIKGQGSYFKCLMRTKETRWTKTDGYLTDVITDLSIDWLKNRKDDKPFCLMVHHKAPHGPDHHKAEHKKLFKNDTIVEPPTLYDKWESRDPLRTLSCPSSKLMSCNWSQYAPLFKTLPREKNKRVKTFYQTFIKGYKRLMVSLDENVGRLLNYIDSTPLKKNTIVIYTSDNGFFLGEHGMFNKMWMYRESLKVPLIVRLPGVIQAGSVNHHFVSNLDFSASFLDLAGAKKAPDMQGQSFLSLLQGKSPKDWRQDHYYHYIRGENLPEHYGVVNHNYKLIHFPKFQNGDYWELFDLKKDPGEMKNIYQEQKKFETVKKLKARLQSLRKKYRESEKQK